MKKRQQPMTREESIRLFEEDIRRVHREWNTTDGIARSRLIQILTEAMHDPLVAPSKANVGLVDMLIYMLSDSSPADGAAPFKVLEPLLPSGLLAAKFKQGRKAGTVSRLRLAVRRELQRAPKSTADEVWRRLTARPPRGLAFYDSPRLGRYIETEGGKDTAYPRFQNIVSEERKALNITE